MAFQFFLQRDPVLFEPPNLFMGPQNQEIGKEVVGLR